MNILIHESLILQGLQLSCLPWSCNNSTSSFDPDLHIRIANDATPAADPAALPTLDQWHAIRMASNKDLGQKYITHVFTWTPLPTPIAAVLHPNEAVPAIWMVEMPRGDLTLIETPDVKQVAIVKKELHTC